MRRSPMHPGVDALVCGVPPLGGKGHIFFHWAAGRTKRSRPRYGQEFGSRRFVETDSDIGAKETTEHVAIHEGGQVPEHWLDVDAGQVLDERTEVFLVALGGLGDLHDGPSVVGCSVRA